MKRFIFTILFALLAVTPAVALSGHSAAVSDIFKNTCGKYVQGAQSQGTNAPSVCQDVEAPNKTNPVVHILKAAIEVVSIIVGIAAVIGILAGSLRLILADGDSSAAATARSAIIYSLIGVVVVVLAQSIVVFVLNKIS